MASESAGSLIYDLDVDKSKLTAGLRGAADDVAATGDQMEGSIKRSTSGIVAAFKNAEGASFNFAKGLTAVLTAGFAGAGFGIKMAADLETARSGFVTLLGSAEKADAALERIKKDAASTPFELSGLVRANQLLSSVTKDADRSEGILLNVGKALAAAGKGGAELDNVIVNLQQIANTGRITEMDIRQFGFAGINILELLADQYGVTKDQAGEMVKGSKDAFGDLEKAFQRAGEGSGRFSRAFIDQAGTFNQLASNFTDVVSQTAAAVVVSTGIFDAAKRALGGIVDALVRFTPNITQGVLDFFEFVKNNGPIILGFIIGGLVPALRALANSFILNVVALAPFLAAGLAIGAVVQVVVAALGGWEEALRKVTAAISFVQGKLAPFVSYVENRFERLKQIFASLGVSGEFGGVQAFFEKLDFYTARGLQILSNFYEKAKGFLAFGNTGAAATFGQAIEGIFNRLQPLFTALQPVLAQMNAQFALAGQVFTTQVVPAFNALLVVLKPLAEAVLPLIVIAITAVVGIVAGLVVVLLGVVTGLASGLANALPFITQALAGIVQAVRGFVQILTGIFTLDLGLVWEGFKQLAKGAFDFFINAFMAVVTFVSGFVKAIIAYFQGLYDVLVGHSIIPDLVNEIVAWFTSMPNMVYEALVSLISLVVSVFVDAWAGINSELSSWPGKVKAWGENIARSFADGFSKLGDWLKDKIKSALDSAKSFLQGQSPPKEGPFKDIDKWGFNVGSAWVEGMQLGLGGLKNSSMYPEVSIPGSRSQYKLPDEGVAGGMGTKQDINVHIGQVNSPQDAEVISREIAFKASLS